MKNLLLVENDSILARCIVQTLAYQKINIQTAVSLRQAYRLVEQTPFQAAVIDRLLDDGDGLELVEFLAQTAPEINLLVISQKNSQPERLTGMRAGAIDYLTKPLQVEELRLKVAKILQLTRSLPEDKVSVGDLELDLHSGVLTDGQQAVQLRRREAELLRCLMAHPHQVMSRDQLINQVWGSLGELPLYSTLDVYVRRLRIRLGAKSHWLKTVRGFGYVLTDDRS